jgi:hypothetical protein
MFKPEIFEMLLVWVGGAAGVQALTELLKTLWKNADTRVKKILNFLAAIIVTVALVSAFLWANDIFSLKALVLYGFPMWLIAAKIYDIYHPKVNQ